MRIGVNSVSEVFESSELKIKVKEPARPSATVTSMTMGWLPKEYVLTKQSVLPTDAGATDTFIKSGKRMPTSIDFEKVERKSTATARSRGAVNKHTYFMAVAHVRYILRKVFRMIDEQARKHDLESLAHQALLQVYGSPNQSLRVNELAERLDIVPAFASNLVKDLVNRKLLERGSDESDMRVTLLRITAAGRKVCHQIDTEVRPHVDYFTSQLSEDERETAVSTLIFYMNPNGSKRRQP
jgi:DNA-binding MarR family transcriptional regulator